MVSVEGMANVDKSHRSPTAMSQYAFADITVTRRRSEFTIRRPIEGVYKKT
jgi:hypothetical protein